MKKKKLLSFCLTFFISGAILFMVGCSSANSSGETTRSNTVPFDLPITYYDATYAFDTNNPEQAIAFCDYVFVAKVESYDGVSYKNIDTIESGAGKETVGDPYSDYTITVLDNLKGELALDEKIPIQKDGGIRMDGKTVALPEDDSLLVVGKVYLVTATVDPESSSLIVSGAGSSILLESSVNRDIAKLAENLDSKKNLGNIEVALQESELLDIYENAATKVKRGKVQLPDIAERVLEAQEPVVSEYDIESLKQPTKSK
jgi:hypothetical protein